jgi:hypothetical protein
MRDLGGSRKWEVGMRKWEFAGRGNFWKWEVGMRPSTNSGETKAERKKKVRRSEVNKQSAAL